MYGGVGSWSDIISNHILKAESLKLPICNMREHVSSDYIVTHIATKGCALVLQIPGICLIEEQQQTHKANQKDRNSTLTQDNGPLCLYVWIYLAQQTCPAHLLWILFISVPSGSTFFSYQPNAPVPPLCCMMFPKHLQECHKGVYRHIYIPLLTAAVVLLSATLMQPDSWTGNALNSICQSTHLAHFIVIQCLVLLSDNLTME